MRAIDFLFIIGVIAFCFYGVYLGIRAIYDIRQNSIDEFEKRRNEIRKVFENE